MVALRAFAVSADLARLRHYQDVMLAPRCARRIEDAEARLTAMSRTLLSLADTRALFEPSPTSSMAMLRWGSWPAARRSEMHW